MDFPLEEKMQLLDEIEQYLESPNMNIEEAITKHEKGLIIAEEILDYLNEAESRLEKIDISKLKKSDRD